MFFVVIFLKDIMMFFDKVFNGYIENFLVILMEIFGVLN